MSIIIKQINKQFMTYDLIIFYFSFLKLVLVCYYFFLKKIASRLYDKDISINSQPKKMSLQPIFGMNWTSLFNKIKIIKIIKLKIKKNKILKLKIKNIYK